MAKLPDTTRDIISRLYTTLSIFGCARWKAMLIYAEAYIKGCNTLSEDIRNRSEGAAMKAIKSLIDDGLAEKRTYADENVLIPVGCEEISIQILNAFDAFSALVTEAVENSGISDFCDAGKSTEYPYHFFFSIQKQQYRAIVYGQDATARIGFFNGVYDEQKDKHYATVLIVPESYGWEEFADIQIKGKTRIAFIQENNAERKTHKCTLTDFIEGTK